MKALLVLLLLPTLLFAGEVKPKTIIKEVTVYLSGAQVTAESTVILPQGATEVLLTGLSPYIDQNSIQISGLQNVSILSINYRTSAVAKMGDSEKIKEITVLANDKRRVLALLQNAIKGLQEEETLLNTNKKLNGDNQNLTLDQVTAFGKYYRERVAAIQNEIYDDNVKIATVNKEISDLGIDLGKLQSNGNEQRGEILLKLEAPAAATITLVSKYNIPGVAGWFPIYDIKTQGVKNPLSIFYNAHVYQNTGEDWDNVKVTLSTGDPHINNQKPDVLPQYLNFVRSQYATQATQSYNYKYNPTIKRVTGTLVDASGMPLPGANVVVNGTNNGTSTDLDGKYAIDINGGGRELVFSYIGFNSTTLPVYAQQMNVRLEESAQQLDEVVVIGYGRQKSEDESTWTVPKKKEEPAEEEEDLTGTGDVKQQGVTATSFKISKAYSIPSTQDVTVIAIDKFDLPAEYEYFSAPLINENVFLTAKIKGWEQFDILPGEANVYFEGSYAGKTFMDPLQTTEEMVISLGVDPQVIVERKQADNNKAKSFLGTNRIVTRNYEISVRNNKPSDINLVLMDRIPVSQNKEIKIDEVNSGGAAYDTKKGLLTWKVNLKAKESVKKELGYQVKYPKFKKVNL